MIKTLLPVLLSLGGLIATLTSALAVAQLPETATAKAVTKPQDGPVRKKVEVEVKDAGKVGKVSPLPRGATAPVEKKVGAMKAVTKTVVRKNAALAVRVNQVGQIQQMMMQIRPILRAEFHVIRVACQPTPEQRKVIANAAEQTLRDATRKYLDAMHRPMTATQRVANDPRSMIQEGLIQAIKGCLTPEQVARYQDEITRRAAGRKLLALRNLVARLDRDLLLSPEQRNKISESLWSHWNDAWGQSLEMHLYDNQQLPPIPDPYVAPILNESQKSIWNNIPKVQVFWGGWGIMGGVMDDDPLEDAELREARLAATKKDGNEVPIAPPMMMEMMKGEIRVREAVQKK